MRQLDIEIVRTHHPPDDRMWTQALSAGAFDCCCDEDTPSISRAIRQSMAAGVRTGVSDVRFVRRAHPSRLYCGHAHGSTKNSNLPLVASDASGVFSESSAPIARCYPRPW